VLATARIFGHKTIQGLTNYYRLNIKIMNFFLNYAQKVVILKSKAVMYFKNIEGADFISPAAEMCAGLAI
jgi:hypothetical protein